MNPAEFHNIARVEETFWWFLGMHAIVEQLLPRYVAQPPARILEAGGGTGDFAGRLRRLYMCPIDLLDLSELGLAYARRKGLDRIVAADVRALPMREGSYDLAFSLDVIVHFPRGGEAPALAELARVLRPGGLLVLRVSALDVLRSRHSEFCHERQRFTRPRLLDAVRGAGLEPLRCTYLNSLLLPVSLFKFRVWEPLTRAKPDSGVQPMPPLVNGVLKRVLDVERAWVASGRDFPAGQSLLLIARKQPLNEGLTDLRGRRIFLPGAFHCRHQAQAHHHDGSHDDPLRGYVDEGRSVNQAGQ